MPKAHLSNVAEPWGHAGLQEITLTRQTRFSHLILKGSACGGFGASSSALPWRGSAGFWGAKREIKGAGTGLLGMDGCCGGLSDWPGAGGAGWALWLQELSPELVPELCSVLRAGASNPTKGWDETFISLSTGTLLHPLPPG